MSKHLIAFTAVLVACGGGAASQPAQSPSGEHHEEHHAHGTSNKELKAPGEAKPGDASRCTVTGEEIEVTEATPHSEHNGKTYYFCCTGCKKKFEANPQKFLKPTT